MCNYWDVSLYRILQLSQPKDYKTHPVTAPWCVCGQFLSLFSTIFYIKQCFPTRSLGTHWEGATMWTGCASSRTGLGNTDIEHWLPFIVWMLRSAAVFHLRWFSRYLRWGDQEPIRPLSHSALTAVPTERVCYLATPKKDLSACEEHWR